MRITFEVAGEPPERLACLQDGSGEFPETGIYAVPEPGRHRYAVGLSETTDAGDGEAVTDPDELRRLGERTIDYVGAALPGLEPTPAGHRHCWVTALPWSDDGLAVWEAGGCLFPVGHNLYKLAPALGRDLAAAACGEELRDELRPESRLGAPPE
jgi:sarcosine oxidase